MTTRNCHCVECPLGTLRSGPFPPVTLRSAPLLCHSEERTPKNLRFLLTRRTVAVTGRPSERDFRFLTVVRDDDGELGMTMWVGPQESTREG